MLDHLTKFLLTLKKLIQCREWIPQNVSYSPTEMLAPLVITMFHNPLTFVGHHLCARYTSGNAPISKCPSAKLSF